MKDNTLRTLFIDELRDLYDAENRLVKAIPKMAKAANSEQLRAGFEAHLEQTKGHVERLKKVLASLGEKATHKTCPAMAGIVKEGAEMMDEDFEGALMDAALISAAQRVEHYEIAAYGCVHAWAEVLGESEAARLLAQTLEEEKETDEKLTELAGKINEEANSSNQKQENQMQMETVGGKARSRSAHA